MPTPATIADIDAAWLADILGASLDSIEVHPIAAGEGFMGQLARVVDRLGNARRSQLRDREAADV